ncbi:hypothetical protein [Paenibacillus sp. MBLB4367]|uniref:hypothetical protein n=1 Tax=Paenibacillus sp. MBLB4367 TaxID=3384767 RepID=UPI003908296C
MRWYEDFEGDLEVVFKQAEDRVARFPAPLNRRGLAYMNGFNPLRKGSAKNYICYLLPFWLKDTAPVTIAECRALSLANVFVMLHFFVQDDLMDTPPSDWKEQLALGGLLQQEYQDLYRELFPSASPFWAYARNLLHDWAQSVVCESDDDPFLRDPLRIAKKAAPLHMASLGALLLAKQEDSIIPVTALVDRVLVTLQMADDWADWRDDLADGSYNCLLSMIRAERQSGVMPAVDEVKYALYTAGALTRYAERALANREALAQSAVRVPYAEAFHESLLGHLLQDAANIEEKRRKLAAGGLHYFLSKNAKN